MALKVVPAGDDRCDIHNSRRPQKYICKSCMQELGIEAEEGTAGRGGPGARLRRRLRTLRARTPRRVKVGVLLGVLALAVVAVIVLATGGGNKGGPPTQSEVVNELQLVSDPGAGTGWVTSDGTCVVISIVFGSDVRPGPVAGNLAIEVANEQGTVGAVVRPNYSSYFSTTTQACADRVRAALNDHF